MAENGGHTDPALHLNDHLDVHQISQGRFLPPLLSSTQFGLPQREEWLTLLASGKLSVFHPVRVLSTRDLSVWLGRTRQP